MNKNKTEKVQKLSQKINLEIVPKIVLLGSNHAKKTRLLFLEIT